jgi:hypothetical protein
MLKSAIADSVVCWVAAARAASTSTCVVCVSLVVYVALAGAAGEQQGTLPPRVCVQLRAFNPLLLLIKTFSAAN